jgi:uncharacterized protein
MKILMTGATGLLGNELGRALVKEGHEITIVTREAEKAPALLSYPCKILEWKTMGGEDDLSSIEAFFHLAGAGIADKRWTTKRKKELRDSRIKTAKEIVSALKISKAQISLVLTSSAVGIYGDRGEESLTEEATPSKDFIGKLCQDWENATKDAFPEARWVAIRTAAVLSEKGGFLGEIAPIFQSVGASTLGLGDQFVTWIHEKDWVKLVCWVAKNKNVSGPINAAAPHPLRNSAWTSELAKALHVYRALPVPAFVLKTAFGELGELLMASQRVFPKKALDAGFKFEFSTVGEALKNIYGELQPGELRLKKEQWIPKKRKEAFAYFCDEKNLESLTPDFLKFRVLGKSTQEIKEGTTIDYQLNVHGLPMKWRTLIKEWTPGEQFIDTQISGPYKSWVHTHSFEDLKEGTLICDKVIYRMPLGWLGRTVSRPFVERDVKNIFKFRAQVLAKLYRWPFHSTPANSKSRDS